MATLVSKVIRQAIREVDDLNEAVATELERQLMGYTYLGTAIQNKDIDAINQIVENVMAPVYGRDRIRATQSKMFYAIAEKSRFMSNSAFSEPFRTLDSELYRTYGTRWRDLRFKMEPFKSAGPTVFTDLAHGRMSNRQRAIRRKLFDPNRRWVNGEGYRLSDRIWKSGLIHRKNIDRVLKQGIRRGDGPVTIAKSLRAYMSPKAAPLRYTRGGRIFRMRSARSRFGDGAGASAARRLARTEVQRAAHAGVEEAVRILQKDIPRAAVIYRLSPSHPKIDICDSYADGSSRGYPRGVYTVDEVPRIPHPNCLCSRSPWVPSRAEVMRDLERQYGEGKPREVGWTRRWDGTGDATDYDWDATNWGDDVSWRDTYNDARTIPGLTEQEAYRLGYDEAKQQYLLQRGEQLEDYLNDYYSDPSFPSFVEVEANYIRDFWGKVDNWKTFDDTLDEAISNTIRSIDLLSEMDDFKSYAPTFRVSGQSQVGSTSTIADYNVQDNVIRLNYSSQGFFGRDFPLDNNDLIEEWTGQSRWWVNSSTESHIIHEFGHTRHMGRGFDEDWLKPDFDDRDNFLGYWMRDRDGGMHYIEVGTDGSGWDNVQQRILANDNVSQYASTDPLEFVAETYVGLLTGERYSDEVMDLYDLYRGIVPSARDMKRWDDYVDRRGPDLADADLEDLLGDIDDPEDLLDALEDMEDDLFPDTGGGLSQAELARSLGIDEDELEELTSFGIEAGFFSEDDFTPIWAGGTGGPSEEMYRLVMNYIEASNSIDDEFIPRRVRPKARASEPWRGELVDDAYDWDDTRWGDSVDYRGHYDNFITSVSHDEAYEGALQHAREEYFDQRGASLNTFLSDVYDGKPPVTVEPYDIRDFWYLSDENIDTAITNFTSAAELVTDLADFEDYAPAMVMSGPRYLGDANGMFSLADHKILIDIEQSTWLMSGARSMANNAIGPSGDTSWSRHLVGNSGEHVFVHEFGHARHMMRMEREGTLRIVRDQWDNVTGYEVTDDAGRTFVVQYQGHPGFEDLDEARIVGEDVSRYAKTDVLEFIAETYSGLLTGERYSDDIMELYRKYGGEEPSAADMRSWREYAEARSIGGALEEYDSDFSFEDFKYDYENVGEFIPIDDLSELMGTFDDMDLNLMTPYEVAKIFGMTLDELNKAFEWAGTRGLLSPDDFTDAFGNATSPSRETIETIIEMMKEDSP